MTELQSEVEERPICGLQMTQPCCAQVGLMLALLKKVRKTNKWVLEKIGSVLMLRKSMAEKKIRLFGHRPEERNGEQIDAREDGRQAEKGQTSNDLVP